MDRFVAAKSYGVLISVVVPLSSALYGYSNSRVLADGADSDVLDYNYHIDA